MDEYEHEHVVVAAGAEDPELDAVSLCVFASNRTQVPDAKMLSCQLSSHRESA